MRYRFFRVLSSVAQKVFGMVVRFVVTTVVFGACAVAMMHVMGVPVPSVSQLLQGFEGLSKLARVLS